jgi:hypothetical protein
MRIPICPRCGEPATITTTRLGARADCCGLRSWDMKPLVSMETMEARKRAHATFDPIWQTGAMTRSEAYRRLAVTMGMSRTECHISVMNENQARRVAEVVLSGALRNE